MRGRGGALTRKRGAWGGKADACNARGRGKQAQPVRGRRAKVNVDGRDALLARRIGGAGFAVASGFLAPAQ